MPKLYLSRFYLRMMLAALMLATGPAFAANGPGAMGDGGMMGSMMGCDGSGGMMMAMMIVPLGIAFLFVTLLILAILALIKYLRAG